MIPFMSVGINYEPINWKLISHQITDDLHEYEFLASSCYKGYSYSLKAVDSPRGQKQHFEILFKISFQSHLESM